MDLGKIAFKCPNANERFPRLFKAIRNNTDVENTTPTNFPGQGDEGRGAKICEAISSNINLAFSTGKSAFCDFVGGDVPFLQLTIPRQIATHNRH
jgi:hypothetical protein